MEPVYTPVVALSKLMFRVQGLRFDITGEEHIPATGGAVIAMNHLSYFDYVYAGLPPLRHGRLVRWMAKKEIFDHPVGGPVMRGMSHIPVDRSAGIGAYREAVAALRRGELVGVFPETTISRSFELRPFKSGAVRMAAEADVPVIPVVAWGNQRIWSKGTPRNLGHRRIPIVLEVGEPLHFTAQDRPEEATAHLRSVMETMLHRAQERYPQQLTGADLRFLPARLGGTAPTPEQVAELEQQERAERAARRRG